MKNNASETRTKVFEKSLRRDARNQFLIITSITSLIFAMAFGAIYFYSHQPNVLFRLSQKRGDVAQTSTTIIRSIEVPPASEGGKALPNIMIHISLLGREIGVRQPWEAQSHLRTGQRVRVTYWLTGSEVFVSSIEPTNEAPVDFQKPE